MRNWLSQTRRLQDVSTARSSLIIVRCFQYNRGPEKYHIFLLLLVFLTMSVTQIKTLKSNIWRWLTESLTQLFWCLCTCSPDNLIMLMAHSVWPSHQETRKCSRINYKWSYSFISSVTSLFRAMIPLSNLPVSPEELDLIPSQFLLPALRYSFLPSRSRLLTCVPICHPTHRPQRLSRAATSSILFIWNALTLLEASWSKLMKYLTPPNNFMILQHQCVWLF